MGNLLPNAEDVGQAVLTSEPSGLEFIEGVSASMSPVRAVMRELAQSDVPVLLLAEPGAGKEATARRIHQMSRQGAKPFRALLCSQLKADDLTVLNRNGAALLGQGTVYLEELADLSADCQARLLAALSQADGERNGSGARLICGSSRDLEAEVRTRRLREDLYYRISGVCLRLPPLRQRKEDIASLLEYFLQKYAESYRHAKPQLSPSTWRLFEEYAWPGNVRELEDAAKVLVVLGDEKVALAGLRALRFRPSANGDNRRISLKAASKAASREAEKELILKTLTRTRWNRRRAAQELQISYKAFLYKLKQIRCEGYGAS